MQNVTHVAIFPGKDYILAVDHNGGRPVLERIPTGLIIPKMGPIINNQMVPVFEVLPGLRDIGILEKGS